MRFHVIEPYATIWLIAVAIALVIGLIYHVSLNSEIRHNGPIARSIQIVGDACTYFVVGSVLIYMWEVVLFVAVLGGTILGVQRLNDYLLNRRASHE